MPAAIPREPKKRLPDSVLLGAGLLAIGVGAGLPHVASLVLGICCCCGVGIAALRRRQKRRGGSQLVSLVLLESETRFADAHILACVIDSAWGTQLASASDDAAHGVVGEAPVFVVTTEEADYLINIYDNAYWENTGEVLPYVSDLRTQRALAEHTCWLSIDLLQVKNATAENCYEKICRLASELARPSTRALLDPSTGAVRAWDHELWEILREARADEIFSARRNAPVVEVPEDDPMMEAAIGEARKRWNEFARAFATRHPEQHFSVKAPVSRDGRTEHIWIEVSAIRGTQIFGRLGNDPVNLGELRLGDPLSVPVAEVEDWLYVLTDRPIGGFTIPAATSAPKRIRRAGR